MKDQDIRWQQRFHQFEKAFALLKIAIAVQTPSIIERAGLIQFFEMAFELSWKLLKDYLEAEGFQVQSTEPRTSFYQNRPEIMSNFLSKQDYWTMIFLSFAKQ